MNVSRTMNPTAAPRRPPARVRLRAAAAAVVLGLALAALAPPLAAQDDPDPESPPIASDWDAFRPEMYSRGDKTIVLSAGLVVPLPFFGDDIDDAGSGLTIGGALSLGYNYFLGAHLFAGGELGFMFDGTRGGNSLFIVPFGGRVGWQFVAGRFEFPVSLLIGAAPQRYQMSTDEGYFGLIVKPQAQAYFRYNPDWSFGLNAAWWLLPQWPAEGAFAFGEFLEITLSARYHF